MLKKKNIHMNNGYKIESLDDGSYKISVVFKEKDKRVDLVGLEANINLTYWYNEKPILDDKEKAYLKGIIKPFKNKIAYIKKRDYLTGQAYIVIGYKECGYTHNLSFPSFAKNAMYKNMEVDKEYTLEELRL